MIQTDDMRWGLFILCVGMATACGSASENIDAGSSDSGLSDSGVDSDTGIISVMDAGSVDAGNADTDAGDVDAGPLPQSTYTAASVLLRGDFDFDLAGC